MRIKDLSRELMALTSPRTLEALLFVPPLVDVYDLVETCDESIVLPDAASAKNLVSEG
jgi:hypothetical protein